MKFIILILLSLLILPFTKENGLIIVKKDRWSGDIKSKNINPMVYILPVVFWLFVFVKEYFGLLDNNINSLFLGYTWILSILVGVSLYFQPNKQKWEKNFKIFSIGVLLLIFVITGLNHFWSAKAKYDSVKVVEKDISEKFTEEDTPFAVPLKTASKKMNKYFGELDKVSYYDLGEITPQIVDGKPTYVAPIELNGFRKALKAEFSPGYIIMSGLNPNADPEVHFDYKMKYIPSQYFGKNLERRVRQAYPNLIFNGEPKFEIDDKGKPFYTMTYGKFVSLRSGFVPEGVVLIDPVEGKISKQAKKNLPSFIDSIVNHESASLMNTYFGKFVHGWWNTIFSETDVKLPTETGTKEGVTPIVGKDGKLYYFTDFTSPKEGVESALGYSLIDAEESTLYYYSGDELKGLMDGSAAIQTVNTKFKKEVWKGTMPVLYNVYGKASWVVPVTDDAGLVQSYAIVAGSNGNVFATGFTLSQAFKNYKIALERDLSNTTKASKTAKEAKAEATVLRVYKEKLQETVVVEILSKEHQQIFMISVADFTEAKFIEPGDKLLITFMDNGEKEVAVIDYVNITLNQMKR